MQGLGIGTDLSPETQPTERERVALEYAEQMTRDANRIPDASFERLHAVFTDAEIVALTFHIGFITMLNLFNNALQVRYQGEFDRVEVR
jgi:alkylhydroperoxidase family enzyme